MPRRPVKPQRCLVGGKDGDCFRACIATICEVPASEVPNFGALTNDCDEMSLLARKWLAPRGYSLFVTYCSAGWTVERVLSNYSADNPGVPVIIAGVPETNKDETHAVVALNGKVVWDPSGAGLSGPYPCRCKPDCELGWWWIYVITAFPCEMEEQQCAA
jgi:hypothetical protein